MKALITGAGIGGLSAAICLRLRGWDVSVLEKAQEITEIGAGLQISANGYRVLQAMGVTKHLKRHQFLPEAIEMRMGVSGHQLFSIPIKELSVQRWGAPYAHIHRADLIAALRARNAELKDKGVVINSEVLWAEDGEPGVLRATSAAHLAETF